MPKYKVEVNFSRRPKSEPDACVFEIEAATADLAETQGRRQALGYHPSCRVGVVTSEVIAETTDPDPERQAELDAFAAVAAPEMGEPAPMSSAAISYLDSVGRGQAPEPATQEHLTEEQRLAIALLVEVLPERSGTRLALELALHTDAESRPRAEHDFGKFGDLAYCARSECQARNQPPVNRWACKGAE